MASSPARVLSFFLLVLIVIGGCGPSTPTVKGKVTYKNTPLTSGEVRFIGGSGPSRSALINSEGLYEIKGAPLGEVRIAVVSNKSGKPAGPTVGGKKPAPASAPVAPAASAIPAKYNDPKTSGLTITVTGGIQSHDIELKD